MLLLSLSADDSVLMAARQARQLPWYVRVVAGLGILGAIGLSLYWVFTDSGLYGWFAGLQADYLFAGRYFPLPTFALIFLILASPIFVLLWLLVRCVGTGVLDDSPSLQDVLAKPASLADAPVSYGTARLINWPEARVTFSAEGLELSRGGATVRCPWALFSVSGSVFVKDSSIVLPVDSTQLQAVTLRKETQRRATGSAVRTAFFKIHEDYQIEIFVDYPGPLSELGEAILQLGQWHLSQTASS